MLTYRTKQRGLTLLMQYFCSIKQHNSSAIAYLLSFAETQSMLNTPDKFGFTALFLALINGCSFKIVLMLLSAGADPNHLSRQGTSCLQEYLYWS